MERRSLKKIRASTGFEPVTSALPVRFSTNWAMKPHIGSEVNLLHILHINSSRSIYFIYFTSIWFVLAAALDGILLPSNMAAKTTLCLYLFKCLIITLRCAVNVTTSSFQNFPWSLSAKFCVQKEVIHNLKNHILVTCPATNLLILRKWRGFEKPNQYQFV